MALQKDAGKTVGKVGTSVGGGAASGAAAGTAIMPGLGTAIGAGAGGVLGLVKYFMDVGSENADKKLRAAEIEFSPWTKMQPQTQINRANLGSDLMTGALGGGEFGQGLSDRDLLKASILQKTDAARTGGEPAKAPSGGGGEVSKVTEALSPWVEAGRATLGGVQRGNGIDPSLGPDSLPNPDPVGPEKTSGGMSIERLPNERAYKKVGVPYPSKPLRSR
jgi:hypothetical protein